MAERIARGRPPGGGGDVSWVDRLWQCARPVHARGGAVAALVRALARARGDGLLESGNASAQHWSEFVLACCVSLCVGIPFAMYHSQVVELGAVLLALCAFVLATGTMALAVVFNRLSAEE